jgi:transcription elongation factor GreA
LKFSTIINGVNIRHREELDIMEEKKEILLTQEGYDNLEKELEYLKTDKRTEIAERIKVALGFGDLSENSEYDEAKSAQASNENKIAELENKIRYARIIDESEIDTKTVQVGNIVTIHDEEFDEDLVYTIVGSTEVDLAQNKISNESPMGAALLGAKKGEVVEVTAPAGVMKYKILAIKK